MNTLTIAKQWNNGFSKKKAPKFGHYNKIKTILIDPYCRHNINLSVDKQHSLGKHNHEPLFGQKTL